MGGAGSPNGGFGGFADCASQGAENGESCDASGAVCQSGMEYCACLDAGSGATWLCIDTGGGGRGIGGFGNLGGFGNPGGSGNAGRGGRGQ
jgi:urocanate hydratase